MKATTWLCPVLTLLCAARLVCTAQRGIGYPLDYADTNILQDDYWLEKRNKPSLSIVNPLDVLRQRLLLEIARRQMKENTRQVELNRAILKNVGKRMPSTRRYQLSLQQQQQQLQHQQPYQHQLQQQHAPQALHYTPLTVTSIFDYLQRPLVYEPLPLDDNKKSLDILCTDVGSDVGSSGDPSKYRLNGNEIGNETNHGTLSNAVTNNDILTTTTAGRPAVTNNAGLKLIGGMLSGPNTNTDAVADSEAAIANDNTNADAQLETSNERETQLETDLADDLANEANAGYQLRYLYRLHKNHYANK